MAQKSKTRGILVGIVICIMMTLALAACGANAEPESVPETSPVSSREANGDPAKKIYFAGPLFSQAEKDFNLKLAKVLEDHGYQVFLPQRDGLEAALLEGKTEEEKTRIIFEKDVGEIMNADIVFMVLDGRVPDEGACVELGIAYANGKRCCGGKTDTRSLELDLDLNPLIGGCFIKLFKDFDGDSLIRTLQAYLAENEL